MADDLWSSLNRILAPAPTDRIGASTGANAGGYSERREFIYEAQPGKYVAGDAAPNYLLNLAAGATARGIVADFNTTGNVGAMISFTQNGVTNNCFGTVPGTGDFGWYVNRNGVADGVMLMRLDAGGRLALSPLTPPARLTVSSLNYAANPVPGVINDSVAAFITNNVLTYGLSIGVAGSGATWLQSQRRDGLTTTYSLLLNPEGGDVGIGTNAPLARLHAKSSGEIMRLETTAAPGAGNAFVSFYDSGGRKGFFGYGGSTETVFLMNEKNGNLELGTNAISRWYIESAGHFTPVADNAYDVGWSSGRIRGLYLGSNPIVSCDVRLKRYRADTDPTAAEHAAALECFEAFGFFQFLDSIALKGEDGARWHFGPRAQQVWAVFASHGLCEPLDENGLPPEGSIPPAFLCFDAWDEETEEVMEEIEVEKTRVVQRQSDIIDPATGVPAMVEETETYTEIELRPTGETRVTRAAGNIFMVRIDQLLSLMLVALNVERKAQATTIADLATRLAALETVS